MASVLAELFRHNLWANLRLTEACASLADGQLDAGVHGTMGTIRETLTHVAGAEARYVRALTGREPEYPVSERDGWPGFDALRASLRWSGEALVDIAQSADEDRMLRLPYRGETHEIALSTLLTQAINHATEHRAQIATIMTQQGVSPPSMDGWSYGAEPRRG